MAKNSKSANNEEERSARVDDMFERAKRRADRERKAKAAAAERPRKKATSKPSR